VGLTGTIHTNLHILLNPDAFPYIAESANAVGEGTLVLDLSTEIRKAVYWVKVSDSP
jgi:hypothetical protein